MRKLLLSLFALVALGAAAQNVQLHYDFGHTSQSDAYLNGRPSLTATIEMFRPDKWGNTFFFIDLDPKDQGIKNAYWEIAREFRIGKSPFSAHLEYNGGIFGAFSPKSEAYLVGPSYAWNAPDFQSGFSAMALYKHLTQNGGKASYQFTGTWYKNFAQGMLTFNGFIDVWNEYNGATREFYPVVLTEPQLWFNFNKVKGVDPNFNLSVGTECEISYNFPFQHKKFYAVPTLALKWTF